MIGQTFTVSFGSSGMRARNARTQMGTLLAIDVQPPEASILICTAESTHFTPGGPVAGHVAPCSLCSIGQMDAGNIREALISNDRRRGWRPSPAMLVVIKNKQEKKKMWAFLQATGAASTWRHKRSNCLHMSS